MVLSSTADGRARGCSLSPPHPPPARSFSTAWTQAVSTRPGQLTAPAQLHRGAPSQQAGRAARDPGAALPRATTQDWSSWVSWQHVAWRPVRGCAPHSEHGRTADKLPVEYPALRPHSRRATWQLTLRAGQPAQPLCRPPRPAARLGDPPGRSDGKWGPAAPCLQPQGLRPRHPAVLARAPLAHLLGETVSTLARVQQGRLGASSPGETGRALDLLQVTWLVGGAGSQPEGMTAA